MFEISKNGIFNRNIKMFSHVENVHTMLYPKGIFLNKFFL